MSLVKFYRGGAGDSLPQHQNGAIFIVERSDTTGDMYVDVEQGKRLHIKPDSPIVSVDLSWYDSNKTILRPEAGKVYNIWNFESKIVEYEEDGETKTKTVYTPGIKVGDGDAYLADLPILYTVTQERKDFWDNKVTAYIGPEENSERLVLSKD